MGSVGRCRVSYPVITGSRGRGRGRGSGVIIARGRGNLVILHGAFPESKLEADLTLGTTRGASEVESSEFGGIVRVDQVLELEPERTNQGLRRL